MLNRLSKCQQEIAISLITLFLISGIIPLKASANYYSYPHSYRNSGYYPLNKTKAIVPFFEQDNSKKANYGEAYKPHNRDIKNQYPKINRIFKDLIGENKTGNKPFIGGPGQPEMGAFKPVGADNMVDLFTGDMSYNIPLLDVGGYPVNIFYNRGITMDQEASWAGLGWNINPGTIMRNMRGVPDRKSVV